MPYIYIYIYDQPLIFYAAASQQHFFFWVISLNLRMLLAISPPAFLFLSFALLLFNVRFSYGDREDGGFLVILLRKNHVTSRI